MGLAKHSKQYFIRETVPATKNTPADNHHYVLTSIQFPPEMIDKAAEELGILGNLSHHTSDLVIKTPFKHIMGAHFNRFDDRERL